MKRIKLAIAFLLLLSFGCGLSAPSIPPSPSVIPNLPTVRPIYSPTIPSPTSFSTRTPSPTATFTVTPSLTPTATPDFNVSVNIQNVYFDSKTILITGDVSGIPKEVVSQINLMLYLYDFKNNLLKKESFPCTDPLKKQDTSALLGFKRRIRLRIVFVTKLLQKSSPTMVGSREK